MHQAREAVSNPTRYRRPRNCWKNSMPPAYRHARCRALPKKAFEAATLAHLTFNLRTTNRPCRGHPRALGNRKQAALHPRRHTARRCPAHPAQPGHRQSPHCTWRPRCPMRPDRLRGLDHNWRCNVFTSRYKLAISRGDLYVADRVPGGCGSCSDQCRVPHSCRLAAKSGKGQTQTLAARREFL